MHSLTSGVFWMDVGNKDLRNYLISSNQNLNFDNCKELCLELSIHGDENGAHCRSIDHDGSSSPSTCSLYSAHSIAAAAGKKRSVYQIHDLYNHQGLSLCITVSLNNCTSQQFSFFCNFWRVANIRGWKKLHFQNLERLSYQLK